MRVEEEIIDRRASIDTRLEITIQVALLGTLEGYFRLSSYSVNGYIIVGKISDYFANNILSNDSVVVNMSAAWELKVYAACTPENGVEVDENG